MPSSLTGQERLNNVLSRLPHKYQRSGKFFVTRCPAHNDKQASLNISLDQKDIVRVVCRTSCERDDVLAKLGLDWRDLYPNHERRGGWQILDSYPYPELNLLRVKYLKPDGNKAFTWWAGLPKGNYRCALSAAWYELWDDENYHRVKLKLADGDEVICDDPANKPHNDAIWFDEIADRILFHAERLESLEPGSVVLMPEGEKDALTAESIGFVATTEGGASDWRPEHAVAFSGLIIVIIPDNDSAGEKRLARVASDCKETAEAVLVLRLKGLPEKGDLTDWVESLRAQGWTDEQIHIELQRLIETEAIEWEPEAAKDDAIERAKIEAKRAVGLGSEDAAFGDYDPELCNNVEQDKALRQALRTSGRLINMMVLILSYLGFEKTHHRFLSALLAYAHGLNTSPLAYFSVSNLKLYQKYVKKRRVLSDLRDAKDDSKAKMVGRDSRDLRDEQDACGVTVLDYIPGKVSFSREGEIAPAYPPKYRVRLFRYALISLNLSRVIKQQTGCKQHEADEQAAKMVAEMIPRREKSARIESGSGTAKAKAKASSPTKDELLSDFRKLVNKMVDQAVQKGISAEALSEEIDDLTRKMNEIASKALSRGVIELSEREEENADVHIVDKNVHKVSKSEALPQTHIADKNVHKVVAAESGLVQSGDVHIYSSKHEYSSHLEKVDSTPLASEDYQQQEINEGRAGPDQSDSCDGCGAYLLWGSSFCGSCGAHYRPEYWQAGTGEQFHASD